MANPRGRPFQPGNKAGRGRPPGSRNPATVAVQKLFEQNAEAVAQKCIQMATKGDPMALRLAMERVLPPCKNTLVHFAIPPVKSLADLPKAADAILQAAGNGEISPAEAEQLMPVLEFIRRSLESGEIEKRLQALEASRPARIQVGDDAQ